MVIIWLFSVHSFTTKELMSFCTRHIWWFFFVCGKAFSVSWSFLEITSVGWLTALFSIFPLACRNIVWPILLPNTKCVFRFESFEREKQKWQTHKCVPLSEMINAWRRKVYHEDIICMPSRKTTSLHTSNIQFHGQYKFI